MIGQIIGVILGSTIALFIIGVIDRLDRDKEEL